MTTEGVRAKKLRNSLRQDKKIKSFARKRAKIREILTEQQKGLCYYCREPLMETCWGDGDHDPTLDHVKPRCEGGKNAWNNLVVACRKCNADKGPLSCEEFDLIRALRKIYWFSRMAMPDAQEDLLGHIEKRDGRLWSKDVKVLPRLWKTPWSDNEPRTGIGLREWLGRLSARATHRHREEGSVECRGGEGRGGETEQHQEAASQRPQVPLLDAARQSGQEGALITRPNDPVLPRIRKAV